MRRLFLTALLGLGALSGRAAAQSVAGEWDASMSTPGGVRSFRIEFKVSGDTLTGTVKREAGDVPLHGTIKGNVVKFWYTISYNENPFVLTMTATVEGDTMKGTVDMGGQAEDQFSAKRVKPSG